LDKATESRVEVSLNIDNFIGQGPINQAQRDKKSIESGEIIEID